jgi:hypothetical protein
MHAPTDDGIRTPAEEITTVAADSIPAEDSGQLIGRMSWCGTHGVSSRHGLHSESG